VHRWMKKFRDGETSTEDKPHWHKSSASGWIDSSGKTSHTPWACCTTGLWLQCCEGVGTRVHTCFFSNRIQELGSMLAQMHHLWWRPCGVVPLYGGSVTLPTYAIWTTYVS
jgi:hypothetical protein